MCNARNHNLHVFTISTVSGVIYCTVPSKISHACNTKSIIQGSSCTDGRYDNALPCDNQYLLCFLIDDLLYLFKRAMNPEESIINEEHRVRMVSELLQIAKLLPSDLCFNVHLEKLLGNPDFHHNIPELCGECTICKNKKLFPQINKEGTKGVFLHLFVFGDYSIDRQPNLKNIVKAIKSYPNVRRLLISASMSRNDIKNR